LTKLGLALLFLLRFSSLAIGMGIVSLALVPRIASASAFFPLPKVVLCGPDFSHIDSLGRHYAIGNLIGTNGQQIYVAETRTGSPRPTPRQPQARHRAYATGHKPWPGVWSPCVTGRLAPAARASLRRAVYRLRAGDLATAVKRAGQGSNP
jgi:hypothetical protein